MSLDITVEAGKSRLLKTAGKVCDRDIVVTATGGSNDLAKQIITGTITSIHDDSIEALVGYAFAYRTKLTEVGFSKLKTAGLNSFYNCTALENVNIPAIESLSSGAFSACRSLEKIDLHQCTAIYANAFGNCAKLATVILRANARTYLANSNAFAGTPIASGTGYIYVPATLKSQYEQGTNWPVYASQFRAIEDYPDVCGG